LGVVEVGLVEVVERKNPGLVGLFHRLHHHMKVVLHQVYRYYPYWKI
jgi:hypothetical protein